MALWLHKDEDARKRFFNEEYFKRTRTWARTEKRDLFREVFKYLLDAYSLDEKKRASKYATVVWHLDSKGISPEVAAANIEIYHGIDAIARHGIPDPVILDPRDVGDGMTATGEKIDYGDDDDEESEEDLEAETTEPSGEATEVTHPGNPDQSGGKSESDGGEAGDAAMLIRVIGSERQLQKLSSVPLGWEPKVRLIRVEVDGPELVFRLRRVVPPKLPGWLGIRSIEKDDEEWYAPDEWEYPEELCD
ncbi:hypothetical protein [Microvirga aerophila]|uniref:Uncharacterized protein n=1 Tax=Microvirga aerophila TaxID=670291 RepID=A0A512BZ91_9HYPH|nr:hypothetical protein [Microvirga aerophila]GEO17275.1 hypothetical protein MAE02_49710 [Microvirga aerophila]